jgi:hypothetical protein
VEFIGLLVVSDIIGNKKVEIDLSGQTVKDVIDELIGRYVKKVKAALYPDGTFDLAIQMAINGNSFVSADRHETHPHGGETLMFILLLPGG